MFISVCVCSFSLSPSLSLSPFLCLSITLHQYLPLSLSLSLPLSLPLSFPHSLHRPHTVTPSVCKTTTHTVEIRFFDERLTAKKNRSRLNLEKKATPFLTNNTFAHIEEYISLSLDTTNSGEEKIEYRKFPDLNPNLCGRAFKEVSLVEKHEKTKKTFMTFRRFVSLLLFLSLSVCLSLSLRVSVSRSLYLSASPSLSFSLHPSPHSPCTHPLPMTSPVPPNRQLSRDFLLQSSGIQKAQPVFDWEKTLSAIKLIQSTWKMKQKRREYKKLKRIAVSLSHRRWFLLVSRRERERFKKLQHAVSVLQSAFRLSLALLQEKRKRKEAATCIVRGVRRWIDVKEDRQRYVTLRRAVLKLQSRYVTLPLSLSACVLLFVSSSPCITLVISATPSPSPTPSPSLTQTLTHIHTHTCAATFSRPFQHHRFRAGHIRRDFQDCLAKDIYSSLSDVSAMWEETKTPLLHRAVFVCLAGLSVSCLSRKVVMVEKERLEKEREKQKREQGKETKSKFIANAGKALLQFEHDVLYDVLKFCVSEKDKTGFFSSFSLLSSSTKKKKKRLFLSLFPSSSSSSSPCHVDLPSLRSLSLLVNMSEVPLALPLSLTRSNNPVLPPPRILSSYPAAIDLIASSLIVLHTWTCGAKVNPQLSLSLSHLASSALTDYQTLCLQSLSFVASTSEKDDRRHKAQWVKRGRGVIEEDEEKAIGVAL